MTYTLNRSMSAFIVGVILTWSMVPTKEAHACSGDTPFLGSMCVVAFNFPPRGWAFAEGQLLPISQNTALFSLIGTIYGGDGRTSFALPDTRGRTIISAGRGPGLTQYQLGQRGGAERVTQTSQTLASHNHTAFNTLSGSASLKANSGAASSNAPGGGSLANGSRILIYNTTAPDVVMHAGSIDMSGLSITTTVENAGGSQSFSIVQPYVALHWVIALVGIFPSRN